MIELLITLGAATFVGGCVWVMHPRHPQRLAKLQKAWAPGPVPPPDNDRD